jgi:hypothetical protein
VVGHVLTLRHERDEPQPVGRSMSKFRHECPEWDFMEIDEQDMEFIACACFPNDPEALKWSEEHQQELDRHNESKS